MLNAERLKKQTIANLESNGFKNVEHSYFDKFLDALCKAIVEEVDDHAVTHCPAGEGTVE